MEKSLLMNFSELVVTIHCEVLMNIAFTDFYAFGVEYRYLVSNQGVFDVFGQLANVRNSTLKNPKLYSLDWVLIFITDWFNDFSNFKRTRI